MKTQLLNPETKLDIDDDLSLWLNANESDIDGVPYKAAILGTDGNAYRVITVSGLDKLMQLSEDLWQFGLVDLLKNHHSVRGFEAIYSLKDNA